MKFTPQTFAIIGAGRAGSSITSGLIKAGWKCTCVIDAGGSASTRSKLRKDLQHVRVERTLSSLVSDFQLLFIAVPDGKIQDVVSELKTNTNFNWKGKTVFHLSGAVEVGVLSPLASRGALSGSLHPIASFSRRFDGDRTHGIYFDYYGHPRALRNAKRVVSALNSKMIVLRSESDRIRLHAASVIASNFVTIAVRSAEKLVGEFIDGDTPARIFLPLVTGTVDNLGHTVGIQSLTGPLARKDRVIIARHLSNLKKEKSYLNFYKAASILGIELLLTSAGKSQAEELRKIRRLIGNLI